MTDLTTLAARIETGTADEQRELLCDAWDALGPIRKWTDEQARKFSTLVDDEGYVDAALMLAPEGWAWSITGHGYAEVRHPRFRARDCEGRAKTPALALAAAALRAHASEAAA